MLSPAQLKKLEKLAKVGDIGIANELNALEGKIEALEAIVPALREAKDGDDAVVDYDYILSQIQKPQDGKDYVLTEKDKREIASTIAVPVVEKVIEKTIVREIPGETIIREIPIVTNEIKEVATLDDATIAYLEDEIKKAQLDTEEFNRAIGIVDQRTQYLVNKASNLERVKIDGIGVHTITVSDTAPANPQTGDIWIDTDAYNYRLVTSSGAITTEDYCIGCDGTLTVTLPTAISFTGEFIIKNVGNGTITVATTSSQTIDHSLVQILAANESMTVRSNNTNWLII